MAFPRSSKTNTHRPKKNPYPSPSAQTPCYQNPETNSTTSMQGTCGKNVPKARSRCRGNNIGMDENLIINIGEDQGFVNQKQGSPWILSYSWAIMVFQMMRLLAMLSCIGLGEQHWSGGPGMIRKSMWLER